MVTSTIDKIKETGRHAVIYGLSNALTTSIGIILIPIYTRYFSTSDYGTLSLILVTLSIFSAIFSLGVNSSLFRFYYDDDSADYRRKLIGTSTILVLSSAVALSIVGVFTSSALSWLIFNTGKYTIYFMLMFFSTSFLLLMNLPLLILRAEKRSWEYSVINIMKFLTQLSLIIAFVVFFGMGIFGVILGTLITHILFCVLSFIYIRDMVKLSVSRDLMAKMFRFGYPLVFVSLAGMVLTYFDQYFISMYRTLGEVGIYNLGYKVGMIMNVLLIAPFYTIWAPMKYSVRKEKNADEYYRRILTYFLLAGVFLTVGISITSRDVLRLIAGREYWSAYKVVPIILLSYLFYGLAWPIDLGISFEKKTKYIAYITVFGAGLNIALNILVIPRYGIMGAATTTLVSYAAMLAIKYYINQKLYPIRYEWGRIAHMSAVATLVFVAGWLVRFDNIVLSLTYNSTLALLLPVILYMTGFFTDSEKRAAYSALTRLFGGKRKAV